MENKNKEDVKEEFCPPCLAAIPIAFAASGVGVSQAIDGTTEKKNKIKNIIFVVSSVIGISAVMVFIYFKFFKKCTTCTD